jgi:hypothetical protein
MKLNAGIRLKADDWSSDVETKNHTPEGLFTKSANEIARGIKKEHGSDFKGAMNALTFYYNRAGDNLSEADKRKGEHAKEALRKLYGKS